MTHEEARVAFELGQRRIGRSPNTIETYNRNIAQFYSFLTEFYPRVSEPTMITPDVIADYQDYLIGYEDSVGKPLSGSTISLKLTTLRSLFRYLVREDFLPSDPTKRVVLPKSSQKLSRSVLTEEEVNRILESCDMRTPFGLRNRAILEVFYACGIRTSELCDLAVHDVDLRGQAITIEHGKGDKSRIVPIGQYATHYVSEYIRNARRHFARKSTNDGSRLFLTQFGNAFDRHSINKHVMRPIEQKIELKKPLTCYAFRRSVATHLLKRGVDVTYIARLLGHESLNTTQHYLKIEIGDLKKVHARYHPRENVQSDK